MRASAFLLIVFLFFFCASEVFAVTLSINSPPSTIKTSEFEISITVLGAKAATNYLKILLYQEGSRDILSKTWNGNGWYSGTDSKQYFPISISGKESTTTIKGQLIETIENGNYLLSIRRYTASGSAADDTIVPVQLSVNIENRNSETIAPSVISKPSSPTPKPVVENSPVPTQTQTQTPPPKAVEIVKTQSLIPIVLATTMSSATSAAVIREIFPTPLEPNYFLLFTGVITLFVGGLCLIVGASGIIKSFPHEVSHDRL